MRLRPLLLIVFAGISSSPAQTTSESSDRNKNDQRIAEFSRRFVQEPDVVIHELDALAKNSKQRPFARQVLEKMAQLDFESMYQRIDVAQALVNQIERLSAVDTGEASAFQWIEVLATSIASDFVEGELRYGSITNHDHTSPTRQEDRERVEAALRSRRMLYRQLCETAVLIPGLSGEYFAELVEFSQYSPISEAELLKSCRQSLAVLGIENVSDYIGNPKAPEKRLGNNDLIWSQSARADSKMGPIPWIIEYAFRTNQPGLLRDSKLLPAGQGLDKAIRTLAGYYFCEPGQFTETIGQVEKFSLSSDPKATFWEPRIQWVMMRRAMSLRPEVEESFELESFVSKRLEKGADYITRQFAVDQIRIISMEKGLKEVFAYLERITGAMSLDLAKLRRDGTEVPELVEFLNTAGPSPACLFPVLSFAKKTGQAPYIQFDLKHPADGPIRSYDIILAIYRSPLCYGMDKLYTFPADDFPRMELGDRFDSIAGYKLHEFLEMLCSDRSAPARKGLREIFAKIDTFGGRLVVSLFEEQAHNAVLDFFREHVGEIEKLPEDKRSALAILAKDIICPACLSKLYSQEDRQTLRWIISTAKTGEFGRLQKYADAKSIAELQIEPAAFKERAGEALNRALGFDWRKAYPAFENLASLGEAAVIKGEIEAAEDSFTYQLIERTLKSADPVNAFAFAVEALQSKSLPVLLKQNPGFESRLFHFMNAGGGEEEKLQRFKDFVAMASSEVDPDSDLSVTVPIFVTLHKRLVLDPGLLPAIANWAKIARGEGSYPELAPYIGLASRLRMSKRGGPTPEAVGQLTKLLERGAFSDSARVLQALMIAYFDDHDSGQLLTYNLQLLPELLEKYGADAGEEVIFRTFRALESRRRSVNPQEYEAQGWTAAEAKLGAAYEAHVLMKNNDPRRFVRPDDSSPFVREEWVRILTKMGRQGAVDKLLGKETPELKNQFQIFAHLVRSGAFDSASEILRRDWIGMLGSAPVHVTFDQALAKQIKPYLKSIEADPDWLQWLAEYLLVRTHVRNGEDPPEGWPKYKTRMLNVGASFEPESFPDYESQIRILLAVIGHSDLREAFKQKLLDLSARLTFSSVTRVKDKEKRDLLSQAYFYRLRNDVAGGDTEEFSQLFGMVDRLDTAELRRNRLQWMQGILTSRDVTEKCKNPVFAREILSMLTEVGRRRDYGEMDGDASTFIAAAIFLHHLMGEPGKIRAYLNNKSFPGAAYFKEQFKGHGRQFVLFEAAVMLHGHRYGIQPFDFGKQEERKRRRRPLPPEVQSTVAAFREIDESFNFDFPSNSKRSAFLAANSIAETGYRPERFTFEVGRMIREQSGIAEKRKIYDQALALVQNALASQSGWIRSYDNGWNASGQIFQNTVLSQPGLDWQSIALLADVFWNDTPRGFSLAMVQNSGLRRCADSMWRQAVIGTGNRVSGKTLPLMLSSLSGILPRDKAAWGHTSVFRPVFFETCAAIDNPALIKGLVRQTSSSEDALAMEFNLAARMWLTLADGSNDPASGDNAPWIEAATAVMELEDRPALRAFFAQHLLVPVIKFCPQALRQNLYRDTAWLMANNESVNGWHLTGVLGSFSAEEKDAYWKITAENLIAAWEKINRPHLNPSQPWLDYKPRPDPVLAMLDLHYQIGDPKAAEAYFLAHSQILKNSAATLALLVREGGIELAEKWLSQERESLIPVSPTPSASAFRIYYDSNMRQQVSPFLSALDSDENRFIARLMIETIPDAEPIDGTTPSRQERIKSIAESFSTDLFHSEKNRTLAIHSLSRYWQISEEIIAALEDYFTKERLDTVFNNAKGHSSVQRALSPVASLVGGKILYQGEHQPLLDFISRSNGSLSEGDQFYAMDILVAMLEGLLLSEFGQSDSLSPSQLNAILESLNLLLENITLKRISSSWGNVLFYQTIIANLLGKEQALATWRSGITAKQQAKLKALYQLNRDRNTFPFAQLFKNDPAKLKRARQAVEADPWNKPPHPTR